MNGLYHDTRIARLAAVGMMLMTLFLCSAQPLAAHCPTVTVIVDPAVDCRIEICMYTVSGRFCATVGAGTTVVPVEAGIALDSVVIITRLGRVHVPPPPDCVDNVHVVEGCCIQACRRVDALGCTTIHIGPATDPNC